MLIIDDTGTLSDTKDTLAQKGYDVLTSESIQSAYQIAKQAGDEQIIIVCRATRTPLDDAGPVKVFHGNHETRDHPLVLLLAEESREREFRGWISGVDVILADPVSAADVVAAVHRIRMSLAEWSHGRPNR